MYEDLDEDQKDGVVNYDKVTAGITALENANKPYVVRDMIEALPEKASVTLADSAAVAAARNAYNALDEAGKTKVGDITKLTEAEEAILKLASESKVGIFTKGDTTLSSSKGFTISGKTGYKGTSDTFTYDGKTYSAPLKMQSDTTIKFDTAAKMKVTIFLHSDGNQSIKVDGTSYNATDNVIEIEIEKGSHTVTKGDGEAWLCYIVLSPIA